MSFVYTRIIMTKDVKIFSQVIEIYDVDQKHMTKTSKKKMKKKLYMLVIFAIS